MKTPSFSSPAFSCAFCVIYPLAYHLKLIPFAYYPLVSQWHHSPMPPEFGPGMAWYGLLATSTVLSLPIGFVVRSSRLDARLAALGWVFSLGGAASILFLLRTFFL